MDTLTAMQKNKNYFISGITISLPLIITLGLIFDQLLIAAIVVVPYGLILGYLIKNFEESKNKRKIKKMYLVLLGFGIVLLLAALAYYFI